MFKKIAFSVPLVVLALSSSLTFAAESAQHNITLASHITSADFYVAPTDQGLVNKVQRMDLNPSTGELNEINSTFEMLHTGGHIESATLTPAEMVSGADKIPLEVSLNDQVLGTTPIQTVGDEESNTNYRARFKIRSLAKVADIKPGTYDGTITLLHSAVLR